MSHSGQQITIKLRADWETGPFWVSVDNDLSDPYDTDEITEFVTLSDELLDAIAAWDNRFQSTLDKDVPQNSGIRDAEEKKKFIDDGLRLAQRIKHEAPHITVEYAPIGGPVTTVETDADQH